LSHRTPVFTRDFVLVCCATLLLTSAQSLVLTALPVYLVRIGFAAGFVGAFIAGFAICALIARLPVGMSVDRFGSRTFGLAGAALLSVGCVLYAMVPFVSWRVPFAATIPVLLPIAGIAHSVGFSTHGTSASGFVAYAAPIARRGEAVGYYGVLMNVAKGIAAGISLLIVAARGFVFLLGIAAVLAALASILWFVLGDVERTTRGTMPMSGRFQVDRRVLLPASVASLLSAGAGVALAFVPLVGVERGVANPGIYFTAVALTSIAFRVVAGRVADSYGRSASIVPGMLLVSAGLMLIARASSTPMLALAGVVYGLGLASADPALQALAIDVAEPKRRGSAMATYYAMVDLGVSAGSVISGQLADAVGYGGAFAAASCAPLVGLGGFLGFARLGRLRPGRPSDGTG
jgi:MFS family permease